MRDRPQFSRAAGSRRAAGKIYRVDTLLGHAGESVGAVQAQTVEQRRAHPVRRAGVHSPEPLDGILFGLSYNTMHII
jgi:hypothetical protein